MLIAEALATGRELSVMQNPADPDPEVLAVMAAVQAIRAGDTEGLAVIIRHCDSYQMLILTLKLFAELLDEQRITPAHSRVWASHAAIRS